MNHDVEGKETTTRVFIIYKLPIVKCLPMANSNQSNPTSITSNRILHSRTVKIVLNKLFIFYIKEYKYMEIDAI